MIYISSYFSPIGELIIAAKNNYLIGLWLKNQKYYLSTILGESINNIESEILIKTKKWLDLYFNHQNPNIHELNIQLIGTDFQKKVWRLLIDIPYGTITTYKEISNQLVQKFGYTKMSPQAIGSAIGRNPISIIIPCHRVVSTTGSLTGYAGGIHNKLYLLNHEKVNTANLFIPKGRKKENEPNSK